MNESMNTIMDAIRIMLHRYKELEKKVGERYGLSGGEMAVLAFLINNPGKDTASDVCYGRMMKKGNVSFLVTSLEMKGLMGKHVDEKDKRIIHLYLKEEAAAVSSELERMRNSFIDKVFSGFSIDEKEKLIDFFGAMKCNLEVLDGKR